MVEVTMNGLQEMRKLIEEGDVDVLRTMVKQMAEALMGAEVDALCGAAHGERHPERVNSRNGYRERGPGTRAAGTIDLAVPKLRCGSLLPRLAADPAQALRAGPRGGDRRRLPGRGLVRGASTSSCAPSASRASPRARSAASRPASTRSSRPTAAGRSRAPTRSSRSTPCVVKAREGGRIASVACVHAVGVSADGRRESLGLELVTERGRGRLDGLPARPRRARPLRRRARHQRRPPGPRGRRRRDPARGQLAALPHALHAQPPDARAQERQPAVATMVRSIFAQPDAASVREQHARVVAQLEERFPAAAELLEEAGPDILAFTAVPKEVWRQVWSNNPLERLNREIRRRTDVVGIFPNRDAALRLVGAVLAEQNDEWADTGRRYMSLEAIAKTLAPRSPEANVEVAMIAA